MRPELPTLSCPVCNSPISIHKDWIVTCNHCRNELTIIWHNERVVSVRRRIYPRDHSLNGTENELLQTFVDCIENNLPLIDRGFTKNIRLPKKHTVIYDSEVCRVKFILGASDYGPVYATYVSYGRLHAPDNEQYMLWNNETCLCWHSNVLGLTVPFIEGISPRQIAENSGAIWASLEKDLNIDFPSLDEIEYPLRLQSKIWERYGKRFFSIFDVREPDLWEEYSRFSSKCHELINKSLNRKFNISPDIERIC